LPAKRPAPRTNDDLAVAIAEVKSVATAAALAASQASTTAAQTATAQAQGVVQILGRLDSLEGIVKASGLNGHSDLLKSFLEQYAATYTQRQAWITVRGDIGHRLHWLAVPRTWLRMLAAATIGGVGWAIANHLLLIWPTPTHP
jgi:hypothetical protein